MYPWPRISFSSVEEGCISLAFENGACPGARGTCRCCRATSWAGVTRDFALSSDVLAGWAHVARRTSTKLTGAAYGRLTARLAGLPTLRGGAWWAWCASVEGRPKCVARAIDADLLADCGSGLKLTVSICLVDNDCTARE